MSVRALVAEPMLCACFLPVVKTSSKRRESLFAPEIRSSVPSTAGAKLREIESQSMANVTVQQRDQRIDKPSEAVVKRSNVQGVS